MAIKDFMKKTIILLYVILAGAMIASAGPTTNFNFSYSGENITASGTLFTNPLGGGQYLVTGITGHYNTDMITGLEPCTSGVCNKLFLHDSGWQFSYDNLGFATDPHLDLYGLLFDVTNVGYVNLYYDGNGYRNTVENEDGLGGYVDTPVTASFSSTPEPSTLLMLGSGIIGVGGLIRRKLKA